MMESKLSRTILVYYNELNQIEESLFIEVLIRSTIQYFFFLNLIVCPQVILCPHRHTAVAIPVTSLSGVRHDTCRFFHVHITNRNLNDGMELIQWIIDCLFSQHYRTIKCTA